MLTRHPLLLLSALALLAACGEHDGTPARADSGAAPAGADELEARSFVARLEATFGDDAPTRRTPSQALVSDGRRLRPASVHVPAGATARLADVRLPRDAREPSLVRDRASGVSIEVRPLGAVASEAAVVDGSVVYRGALGQGGGDGSIVQRAYAEGAEDWIFFERRPARETLTYRIDLGEAVAGLRLVADTLELLDATGVPRLRASPPYVVSVDGAERRTTRAHLVVRGCAVDERTADPRGREPVPPGARSCEIDVSWAGASVGYPALVDPGWTTTGSLPSPNRNHLLTLLDDGRVLSVGGVYAAAQCQLYDPASGTWSTCAAPTYARTGHTATKLLDGRVLVVGGSSTAGVNAEIFDPSQPNPTWVAAGTLTYARSHSSATLLANGQVLVSGGASVKTAELFDPAASGNPWSTAGTMVAQRSYATSTLLSDGRVLVAGGTVGSTAVATAELYDPAASGNPWASTGSMSVARSSASAAVVGSKVFVLGGANSTTVDVFDPSSSAWSAGPPLLAAVSSSATVQLATGDLLFVELSGSGTLHDELYETASGTWWSVTSQGIGDGAAGVGLADGRALFSGGGALFGSSAAYLFDPTQPDAFLGGACNSNPNCKGGICADGYCCDAPCNGCMACYTGWTGQPNGHCAAVKVGTDPHSKCLDTGSPACATDGACDGAGACENYPVTSGCTPQPCSFGAQCASGACADGICCDTPCTGKCEACTAASKGQGVDGVCGPIVDGSDPQHECGAIGSGVCGGDGVCDGAGACRSPNAGNICNPSSCAGLDAQNNASTCSAAGTCTNNGISSCYPYVCGSAACLQSCSKQADCAQGTQCVGGSCIVPKANGLPCSTGSECTSAICVEGVCCDSICDGECDSCVAAAKAGGSSGICGPRKAGASCGANGCLDATTLATGKCDGLGTCATTQQSCAPGTCEGAACVLPDGGPDAGADASDGGLADAAPIDAADDGDATLVDAADDGDADAFDAGSLDATLDVTELDAADFDADDASEALDASSDDASSDGAAGAGGSGGNAGAAGSGGTGGGDGSAGASGSAGTGGAAGQSASDAAVDAMSDAPGESAPASGSDDGGCGCRVPAGPDHGRSAALLAAMAILGSFERRRRRHDQGRISTPRRTHLR